MPAVVCAPCRYSSGRTLPSGHSWASRFMRCTGRTGVSPAAEVLLERRERGDSCRESVRSGFGFGLYCVGSSIGLMLMLVALSVMSVTWMAVIAVLVLAQKLLPAKAAIDVPLALAIGEKHDRSQDRNTGRVVCGPPRAARGREGAHEAGRRAG